MTRRSLLAAMLMAVSATLASCTGLGATFADAQRVEGTFERTLAVTDPVTIDVSSGSGSIEVRAGSVGQVLVQGRISAQESDPFRRASLTAEERVSRIQANPPIRQSGNQIQIGRIDDEALRQNVSISYTVTVPTDSAVVSRTGSGSVEVEGLQRGVEAAAGSGSIRIRNAGGDVRASAGSGSITAERVGGALDAYAGSGSINANGIAGAARVRTGSGSITVSQTGAADVEASAGSGSIDLSGVRRGVKASSGSGSVSVRGEQASDWQLSSASGNVSVELSGRPAFTLDAHSSSGSIDTAFPVTVTGAVDRRQLRGSVNGGGPMLSVRTSSGSIRIR